MKYLYLRNTRPNRADVLYPVDGPLTVTRQINGTYILSIGKEPICDLDDTAAKHILEEIALSFLQRDVHAITLVRDLEEKREMQAKMGDKIYDLPDFGPSF